MPHVDLKALPGFTASRTARDEYARGLWLEHGLGEHPSFASMEKKVKGLFIESDMKFEAMSIALGREVTIRDLNEHRVALIFLMSDAERAWESLYILNDFEVATAAKE